MPSKRRWYVAQEQSPQLLPSCYVTYIHSYVTQYNSCYVKTMEIGRWTWRKVGRQAAQSGVYCGAFYDRGSEFCCHKMAAEACERFISEHFWSAATRGCTPHWSLVPVTLDKPGMAVGGERVEREGVERVWKWEGKGEEWREGEYRTGWIYGNGTYRILFFLLTASPIPLVFQTCTAKKHRLEETCYGAGEL